MFRFLRKKVDAIVIQKLERSAMLIETAWMDIEPIPCEVEARNEIHRVLKMLKAAPKESDAVKYKDTADDIETLTEKLEELADKAHRRGQGCYSETCPSIARPEPAGDRQRGLEVVNMAKDCTISGFSVVIDSDRVPVAYFANVADADAYVALATPPTDCVPLVEALEQAAKRFRGIGYHSCADDCDDALNKFRTPKEKSAEGGE